jgi:uncharacterized protein (DUF1501 family)
MRPDVDDPTCTCDPAATGPSRRALLAGFGGLAAAAGVAAPQLAFAAGPARGDVIVQVFLRGGWDGLSAVVPWSERAYHVSRPGLRVPESAVTKLSSQFGLHPALSGLHPMYKRGHLAIVHAVGSTAPTRSHFDAQEWVERGTPGSKSIASGWLGRHLATRPGSSPFRALAIGHSAQISLHGPVQAIALRTIRDFKVLAADSERTLVETTLDRLYAGLDHAMAGHARTTVSAVRRVAALTRTEYKPANGAKYPANETGRQLAEVARLIRAGVGLEAACVDVHGWDMHSGMGGYKDGQMTTRLAELASALNAFYVDLGALRRVTVVVMSEFGRRVDENGSGGTDHGAGTAMLVLGSGIRGGRVYTRWPGVGVKQRVNGDLAVTTDYRSVLAEVVARRGLNNNLRTVFPRFAPRFVGLSR